MRADLVERSTRSDLLARAWRCHATGANADAVDALLNFWTSHGAQSVRMPALYVAALMASDTSAVRGLRAPWPAFEIPVPPGALPGLQGDGDVFSLIVADTGSSLVLYVFSPRGTVISNVHESIHGAPVCLNASDDELAEAGLSLDYGLKLTARFWSLASNLAAGACLAVASKREGLPGAYAGRALREKRGLVRPNEFAIGEPLKLDCRQAVSDYLAGRRSSSPSVATLVRGHWRHQPFGPNRESRRLQWIRPFFRGEGPLLVRPTLIGGAP